jgi:hypothetical protein
MPLLAGAGAGSSVDTGQTGGPAETWSEDVGTMRATWTSPDGTVYELTDISPDLGWFTTVGPSGWGAVPIELVTDPLARGGEQVRFIRVQARNMTWPLHIWGETHQEFVSRYRRIMRAFTSTTHKQAPGILTIYRPNGRARQIYAYYKEGFGGESGENWLSANPVLTLYCPEGYWTDTTDTIVTRANAGSTSTNFYTPFITIGTSQSLGATSVTNPGEVDAWPRWTITGPMSKITAVNNTLGVSFALTYALTEGQQIKITTNRPTVRGPGDKVLTGALDWPSAVLWPLAPGTNAVEFQVDGSATGTRVDLGFRARYEGA